MIKSGKHIIDFTIIVILCLCVFFLSLGSKLFEFGTTQWDASGDGLKNYYTFAYQYLYGKGMSFEGMLYPYGDIAIYADAQILLVWILQGFRYLGLSLDTHLLLILYGLPILSFGIGGYFIYRILLQYKVQRAVAILFAIACIMLSPQAFRLQSHYALSYALVIPVYWYGLVRYLEKQNTWQLLALVFFVFLWGLIHVYYVLLICLFAFSFAAVESIRSKSIRIDLVIAAIIPLLVFFIFLKSVDPYIDRPQNPYGMLEYRAEVSDIFPFFGFFHQWFDQAFNLRNSYHEGYAYAGILTIVVPFIYIIRQMLFRIHKIHYPAIKLEGQLISFFVSALMVLAISLGLHVMLTDGIILDMIPPLKQFRTLGRLSWVYYYVGFVFFAIVFYKYLLQIKIKKLQLALLTVLVLLWSYEIYAYHSELFRVIEKFKSKDVLKTNTEVADILADHAFVAGDFQAVFSLPVSTEGAEKLSFVDNWHTKMHVLPFSYQTGLPVTSCIMSRVSISRALNILQMTSSAYVKKEVLDDLNSFKPLLTIVPNNRIPSYIELLHRGEFIDSNEHISLYSLPISALEYQSFISEDSLIRAKDLSEIGRGKLQLDSKPTLLFYEDFESFQNTSGLLSQGSLLIENGSEVIFDKPINSEKDINIRLSFWYKIQKDKSNVPNFVFEQFDENGKVLFRKDFRDWNFHRPEIFEDWIRLDPQYVIYKSAKRIKFEAFGKHLIIDNFLMKSKDQNVFSRTDNEDLILYNHHIATLMD